MKNIVCVASTVSVGCTFVDWSIHFLAGKSKFYSIENNQWVPLSTNPVTKINAHGHKKNHPQGLSQSLDYLYRLAKVSDSELLSFYPWPCRLDEAARQLGIEVSEFHENFNKIQHYLRDDYINLFKHLLESSTKVIHIIANKQASLYSNTQRVIAANLFTKEPFSISTDSRKHNYNLFFPNSIKKWSSPVLDNVWDERESSALNIRPLSDNNWLSKSLVNCTNPYLQIDCQSLWYNGKNAIKKIMAFLEIHVDEELWEQWTNIYYQWQQIQLDIAEFEFNCEHILHSIINNNYYEMGDLTFEQEIIIQHFLIYKHGLNLKTWQLEKFPSNTQDLHKLLEPNIHPIPSIY